MIDSRAPSWSEDENLLSRCLNQEAQVYETNKMDGIAHRTSDFKVDNYSISPGSAPYHFLFFVKGTFCIQISIERLKCNCLP